MPSSKEKRAQRHQSQSKQNITRFSNRGKVTEKVAGVGYRETQLIGGKKYYSALSDDPNIALGGSTTNNVTVIGDTSSGGVSSHSVLSNLSIDDHPQYLLVDGSRAMTGDLSLGGGDGALTFTVAGENSIKIPDDQASALIIEEANTAYLTFTTTNSGEKITLGKKLEAGSVEIEGSNFDINGGQIDGVSINTATINGGLGWSASQDGATFTNINIDSGAIDGTAIGANSHTTIKGTTIDATTDFTIDGLVLTADNITNDADLTITASSKIVLNSTTVGVGDGDTNLVGYGVNARVLTVLDEGTAGDYGAIEIGGYRTNDGLIGDLNFVNTDGNGASQARAIVRGLRDGANDAMALAFFTEATGGSVTERMRIASDGDVTITGSDGTVSGTADVDGDELIIRNNNDSGMSILAGESSGYTSNLIFGSASDLNGANVFYEYYTKTMKLGTQHASGVLILRSGNGTNALTIGSDQSATFTQTVNGDAYISLDNVEGAGSSVNETAGLRLQLGDGSTLRGGAKVTAKKEADFSSGPNMDASMTLSVLQNNAYHDAVVISGATGNSTFYGDVLVGDDLFLTSSGSVINWNSGDVTLTHASGKLTFGGDGAVELDFNNHEMTNVDIDSGTIDGTTIGTSSHTTIKGTTIDATTDFTIGGTVITDAQITDDGHLAINGVSGVTIKEDGTEVIKVDTDKKILFNNYSQTSIYNLYGWNNQATKYHFTSGLAEFKENFSVLSMFEESTTHISYPI